MVSKYKIQYLFKDILRLKSLTYKIPFHDLNRTFTKLHMINMLSEKPKYYTIEELVHDCTISKSDDNHFITITCSGQGNYIRDSLSHMLMQNYEPINPRNGDVHSIVSLVKEIFHDNSNCISGNFKKNHTAQCHATLSCSPYYFTDTFFTPLYNHVGMRVCCKEALVDIEKLKEGWKGVFEPQCTLALEHANGFSFSVRMGRWVMRNMDALRETGLNHLGLFMWLLNKKDDFSVAG